MMLPPPLYAYAAAQRGSTARQRSTLVSSVVDHSSSVCDSAVSTGKIGCIVHKHMQCAEFSGRLIDHAFNIRLLAYVRRDDQCISATLFFDLL